MTTSQKLIGTVLALALGSGAAIAAGALMSPSTSPATTATVTVATVPVAGSCHTRARGALPDAVCTPGSLPAPPPGLAQLCKPGYTATVRPPLAVTEPLKRKLIRAYGLKDQRLGDYELDHLVPLELGGTPLAVSNLWPEKHPASYTKDKLENQLHRDVCAGRLDLGRAQRRMATDWRHPAP